MNEKYQKLYEHLTPREGIMVDYLIQEGSAERAYEAIERDDVLDDLLHDAMMEVNENEK